MDTEIKIEKGIPYPLNRARPPRFAKYPWAEMEVGDSFFVLGARRDSLASVCSSAGARLKRTFRCLVEDDGALRGIRVWRLE